MYAKNEFDQVIGHAVKNWQPAQRPLKGSLRGAYCIVEPLDIAKHAELLFTALQQDNSGESWTYLPYGPFNAYHEFKDWLIASTAGDDPVLYAVIDIKTQCPAGIAGYLSIKPEHGVIEIGHLHFSKLLKQTPAATEAMYLMMRDAFEELGYRRYEWKCNSLNKPSCRAAERLGFKYEGTFRAAYDF
jgi:RimJ/RimL family protein N-acetyltransferase